LFFNFHFIIIIIIVFLKLYEKRESKAKQSKKKIAEQCKTLLKMMVEEKLFFVVELNNN